MAARIDPFVDVLLREQADQLYLLPDEPVTLMKDGKPRKVSKQPLTDAHIYALLTEVAPSDAADKIDQQHEIRRVRLEARLNGVMNLGVGVHGAAPFDRDPARRRLAAPRMEPRTCRSIRDRWRRGTGCGACGCRG